LEKSVNRSGREEKIDILVISDDVVGEKMAGPGIRAWEITKCLAKHFAVALAYPDFSPSNEKDSFFKDAPFEVFRYSVQRPSRLQDWGKKSRIILLQGYVLSKFPRLTDLKAHLIADIYVPFVIENLFNQKWKVPSLRDREHIHLHDLKVFNGQILACDHFLCANNRQRDLFTGSLMSLNRIHPEILDTTPGLDELISIVPFGLSAEKEPRAEKSFIQETFKGIDDEDVVFLWGGVLTNWFDPLTLIGAFAEARKENPKIKLLFMSTQHANPLLPEFDMAGKAIRASDDLGMTGQSVFFNTSWVDYNLRGQYFAGADVGLSLNPSHFENHFAARTRILDYLRHNLPILCTEGDEFSARVKEKKLGLVVSPGDREGLKGAILTLAEDRALREEIRRNIGSIKSDFTWVRTTEPLVAHCRKVLSAQVTNKRRPTRQELHFLFFRKQEPWPKKIAKRIFWRWGHKLPFRLTSKMKRLLRT
jgi:glycosyltransferase involved in cell wall biosynthesis